MRSRLWAGRADGAAGDPREPVIAYVGVVPERRGPRYVDDLIPRAIATLTAAGAEVVRADTDVAKVPVAKACERAGFPPFMSRAEYMLDRWLSRSPARSSA
jgi:hypothetical protein